MTDIDTTIAVQANEIICLRAENEKLVTGQHDVYAAAREEYRKKIAEQAAENERLRAALLAFADHFGPLEDNEMLHPEARRSFALARAALAGPTCQHRQNGRAALSTDAAKEE